MNENIYEKIIKLSLSAYAHHKIILDKNNNPIDYIFLDINKAFEEMTGLKAEDIINKKVTEVIPDIRKGDFDWINFFGNVAINQTEEFFEQYLTPLNRCYKGNAFSTEKGYFTISFTDITNEYKMVQYARETLEILKTLIEESPNSITILDHEGNYIFVSKITAKFLGLKSKEDLKNKNIKDVYPSEELYNYQMKNILKVYENKKTIRTEYNNKINGRYLETWLFPVNLKEKTLIGLITIDITDKKISKKMMLKAKEEAEKANKSKSLFLSTITHDMKTYLAGILGFNEIIKKDIKDIKILKNINYIQYSANHMENLIHNILDISKIEADSLHLKKNSFNIHIEIDELINSLSLFFKQKNNIININIDNKLPKIILGDNYRLKRIIQNLLINSNNNTDIGEIKLDIKLEKETKNNYTIKFIISDTGIGIKKEKLNKLFVPYYQAHDFDGKGTGLGLVLCKELVELMNGEINIESEANKGTTVTFTAVFEKDKKGDK